MSDVNVLTVTGRLVKDAVRKVFPKSGKAFLELELANNTGFNEWASTQYFKCTLIGEQRVNNLLPYLNKGKLVAVIGKLESNNWTDNKTGALHRDWKLKVDELVLLGDGKGAKTQGDLFNQEEPEDPYKKQAQERYQNHGKSDQEQFDDIPF